jgi:hypothetical protein
LENPGNESFTDELGPLFTAGDFAPTVLFFGKQCGYMHSTVVGGEAATEGRK